MVLKIYADPMSQPCRALIMFCRAANIPHQVETIQIQTREHKTPEFTEICPAQIIPAIQDEEGLNLFDSATIFRYLTQKYPVEDHWYPADTMVNLKVEQYLHWHHMNIRLGSVNYFWKVFLNPKFNGEPVAEADERMYTKQYLRAIKFFQKVFLKEGENRFVAGTDDVTVADLQACCELEQCSAAGFDVRLNRPIIKEYMDRVRSRMQPHYDAVHEEFYKFKENLTNTSRNSQTSML